MKNSHALTKQYNYSLNYLDLIRQCEDRISVQRNTLRLYDTSGNFHPVRLHNTRESIVVNIERYKLVKGFLVSRLASISPKIQRLLSGAISDHMEQSKKENDHSLANELYQ